MKNKDKNENKKRRRLFLLPAAAAVIAATAGIAVWMHTGRGIKVEKAVVTRSALKDTYTEEGRLTGGGRVAIISEVSGPVTEICVERNREVHAGDPLYRIADNDYRFQKQQAESVVSGLRAQLDQSRIGQVMTSSPTEYMSSLERERDAARAAFESAQTSYNAAQALYATGDVARVELEQISAQYQSAQAAYTQAKARYEEGNRKLQELQAQGLDTQSLNERFYGSEERQLEAQISQQEELVAHLEEQIGKCEVRADRDGRVISLPVKDMTTVQAGQVTVELQGMEEASAEADVLTSIAPYIRPGDPVEIKLHLRGGDETTHGVITEVYDYAEKGTSALGMDEYRVHVRAKLTEALKAEHAGYEGYGVDLVFTLFDENDALVVPSGAVFHAEDRDYVYVVENGHAVRREITVVYSAAAEKVIDENRSNVRVGETVIDSVDTKGIFEGAAVH